MNTAAPADILKIAVITDFHFPGKSSPAADSARRSNLAGPLLRRAIERFNGFIKPDVVLILGDLLEAGDTTQGPEDLVEVKRLLDAIEAPMIVLPGNHDPEVDEFYAIIAPPPLHLDVKGYRIIPFRDCLAFADWSGMRSREDIERLAELSRGFEGRVISCQHMSLHPPGTADIDFNLRNADEVIRGMLDAGVLLSVGGHFHRGAPLLEHSGCSFLTTPTMCQHPFYYQVIEIDAGRIEVDSETLSLPATYPWYDYHVHTDFAYCVADKGNAETVDLAKATGIQSLGFAEHSGQLYFADTEDDDYWARLAGCFRDSPSGPALADLHSSRMERFLDAMQPFRDRGIALGLEVDVNCRGELMLAPKHRGRFDFLFGAVHCMPSGMEHDNADLAIGEYLFLLEGMLRQGVDVLAHPLRYVASARFEVPDSLFSDVVALLSKYGTAAEINFHHGGPEPEFLRMLVEAGVKLVLSSDTHQLWEVGEFYPHLRLLDDLGYGSSLDDILWHPPCHP